MRSVFMKVLSVILVIFMLMTFATSCGKQDKQGEATEKATDPEVDKNDNGDKESISKPLGDRVPYDLGKIPLARRAASEGMVLLKNEDSALPLMPEDNVALIGDGVNNLYGGGTGSGSMKVDTVNLLDGMKTKQGENKLTLNKELVSSYSRRYDYVPSYSDLKTASKVSDTAVYTICRLAGEGGDRSSTAGDYRLSVNEKTMLDNLVSVGFEKIIVVLNVGGVIDTTSLLAYPQVKAILLSWQPGQYAGDAIADVLVGDVNPSGKLVDTFAKKYADYPSSKNFNVSTDHVDYTEDIFVGYRYFETFDPNYDTVNFEFGFGLSYTTFEYSDISFGVGEDEISVSVKVTNTGGVSGKESVQLYFSAPQGKLGKPAKELCAFAKTDLLEPGTSQILTMTVDIEELSSYDDVGKVQRSAYVIEAGEYEFLLGSSVKNVTSVGKYTVAENVITRQLSEQLPARLLNKRLLADGSYEDVFSDHAIEVLTSRSDRVCIEAPEEIIRFEELYEHPELMDSFLAQLTPHQMIDMCYGNAASLAGGTGGIGYVFEYGIPSVETADGPAGLRITNPCTAWPVATLLACTWDTDLLYEIGEQIGAEAKREGVEVWLAPAVNIHRDPLCGRNFEYYSEDPFLSGMMAASITNAVQKNGVGVCIKHFVGNEKEGNRNNSDSRMSERALREIYLRPFEIAIKEADPWMMMSSYNYVNGVETAESYALMTEILRNEWGYGGVVCTDWGNNSELYRELLAGNDVKMPNAEIAATVKAYDDGILTRAVLEEHAERIVRLLLKFNKKLEPYDEAPAIDISDIVPTVIRSVDYIGTNGGKTERCEDIGGTANTTNNDRGRYIYYKINVATEGEYQVKLRIASPEGKGGFDVLVDGEMLASFKNTEATGGWQKWIESKEVLTLTLPKGEHLLKLSFTESAMNLNTMTFIPVK